MIDKRDDADPDWDGDEDIAAQLAQQVETSDEHDAAVLQAIAATSQRIAAAAGPSGGDRTRSGGRWWPMAVAASLAAMFAFVVVPPMLDSGQDVQRAGEFPGAVSPLHRASLAEAPSSLQWPGQEGATGYAVTLRDSTGAVVHSAASEQPELELPDDIVQRLQMPDTYIWSVRVASTETLLGPFWVRVDD